MELTTEQLNEIERLHAAATAGPWEFDSEDNVGDYNCKSYAVFDGAGRKLCDTQYSEAIDEHQEYDENGVYIWDEAGRRNTQFIAAAYNIIPKLIAEIRGVTLAWTSDAPTEPGWYWYIAPPSSLGKDPGGYQAPPNPCFVFKKMGELFTNEHPGFTRAVHNMRGLWAGPISMPDTGWTESMPLYS